MQNGACVYLRLSLPNHIKEVSSPFMKKKIGFTLLAIAVILIWGTTFVSTKVLLRSLSPVQIMVLRYIIGYLALFMFYPRMHRSEGWRQELLYLGAALSGSTFYFLAENYALTFTQASNVSLLISAAPILTSVLAHFLTHGERFSRHALYGFFSAMLGIFLVVCNGHFVLKISPAGDLLAVLGAFMWACYSLLIRGLHSQYSPVYVTRRIFFYAILTMLPCLLLPGNEGFTLRTLADPLIIGNLLFLGVGACAVCFVSWTYVIRFMGPVRANNFIYLTPLITMVASVVVLHEKISPLMLVGAAFVLAGVILADGTILRSRQSEQPVL